jgi:DNA polymerase III epsilon subunit-like protein
MIHFIDCETSGVTEDDEVISVAIATWDDGAVDVRYHKHFFCQGTITPEAQKVNGYDSELWWKKKNAQNWYASYANEVASALGDLRIWGGSNPDFDRRMLRATFRRVRVAWPHIGHRNCDVASLAVPLLVCGKIEHTGLGALMQYFGLGAQTHTALEDVQATIQVWERLLDLYGGAIMGAAA